MQQIRTVLLQIGVPNSVLNVKSAEEASAYLEYEYGSKGYELNSTQYTGDVRDATGNVVGYKFAYHFVKSVPEVKAK